MKRHRPTKSRADGAPLTDWTKWLDLRTMREVKARQTPPPRKPLRRRMVRYAPLVVLVLLAGLTAERCSRQQEEKLWRQCRTIYETKNLDELDTLAKFIAKYPRSVHAEDANYYYATLADETQPCESLRPMWTRVLKSKNEERAAEAAVRLGDCAAASGEPSRALEFYERVVNGDSTWVAEACLGAGRIAEANANVAAARRYYHRALARSQTNAELVEAAKRLGTLDLAALAQQARQQHVVQSGESAYLIAHRYGLTLNALLAQNRWMENPHRLFVGDVLLIPPTGFHLIASLGEYALYLMHKGRVVRYYPVEIGAPSTPTPLGDFVVKSVEGKETPTPSGKTKRYWIGFHLTGYGIEGGATLKTLRTASTEGALRLMDADAEELARLLPKGTPVRVVRRTGPLRWSFAP